MTWDVEYTDEFGKWWGSLIADRLYSEHLEQLRREGETDG